MKDVLTGLIRIGRAMRTTYTNARGGLIQLKGNSAYLINDQRSAILKIDLKEDIGEGTFYSSEIPVDAETITLRDDRVMFEWMDGGKTRRVLIPNKGDYSKLIEKILKKEFKEPDVPINDELFDLLDKTILLTRLEVIDGNKLLVVQQKANGEVELQNEIPLNKGLSSAFGDEEYEGATKVISSDLLSLKGVVKSPLKFKMGENHPLSVSGTIENMPIKALFSHTIEER
ncbi:MAG: hypothetical protein KKD44_28305 [Proteobacteria bacterium]|nr:hypothetical protein [Pseudomonadota bacterium]